MKGEAGKSVEHEFWHLIADRIGNHGVDMGEKAYYNVYGEYLTESALMEKLRECVSPNAVSFSEYISDSYYPKKKYQEIIPEVMVKAKYTKDPFVIEFAKLIRRKADEKL